MRKFYLFEDDGSEARNIKAYLESKGLATVEMASPSDNPVHMLTMLQAKVNSIQGSDVYYDAWFFDIHIGTGPFGLDAITMVLNAGLLGTNIGRVVAITKYKDGKGQAASEEVHDIERFFTNNPGLDTQDILPKHRMRKENLDAWLRVQYPTDGW